MRSATRNRSAEELHLIRFDADRAVGWQVRMPVWYAEPIVSKFFSDNRFGSSEAARAAAREFRDGLFARANLPLESPVQSTNTKSRTGLVGVSLCCHKTPAGSLSFRWLAVWSENKVQRRKGFSVETHGFEEALLMAIECRERATGVRFSAKLLSGANALKADYLQFLATGIRPENLGAPPSERVVPQRL